ncbi:hypothetical protein VZQ01_25920 [Myxococcus faecalis]|uniref:hypothetical protein n=1 Tax=Myxococcus faecalis TaxID=3115646 RepID=UPI003CFA82E4
MILPRYWDRLTTSLHVVDLQGNADEAWRFLVYQGLVEDTPEGQRFFEGAIQRSQTWRGYESGGAVGFIANELKNERLLEFNQPRDPDGHGAKRAFRLWKRRSLERRTG